jgi:hypothetical protein
VKNTRVQSVMRCDSTYANKLSVNQHVETNSRSQSITLVKRVIEENSMGKRPLGRPKLRWEDGMNREVERMCSLVPIGEKQRRTEIKLNFSSMVSRD